MTKLIILATAAFAFAAGAQAEPLVHDQSQPQVAPAAYYCTPPGAVVRDHRTKPKPKYQYYPPRCR